MRIVYMGNNIRGVVCLKALLEHEENVVGVVVHPDVDDQPKEESVKHLALCNNIPCIGPRKINSEEALNWLRKQNPDLIVMAGYNQILKKEILDIPKFGCINLHGGKLPEYRGVSPINWQIINGEKIGGISIIFVDEGIDTGDIIAQSEFPIQINDTAKTVLDKTLKLFPSMLIEVIEKIRNGTVERIKQNPKEGCYYTRRYPRDGLINWREMTAFEVHNLVRALVPPYPGAFTYFGGKKLFIWKTSLLEEDIKGIPGRVVLKRENGVIVICKDRGILVEEIGFEGKDIIKAKDFFKAIAVDLH